MPTNRIANDTMTPRDWFAASALQRLAFGLAMNGEQSERRSVQRAADAAYAFADAMVHARKRSKRARKRR